MSNRIAAPVRHISFTLAIALSFISEARSQTSFDQIQWQNGPTQGVIGDKATIQVPEGYTFLNSENSKILLELTENVPNGNEYIFAPTDLSWFSVFTFSPVGYVPDDEALDADSILDSVRDGTSAGNVERKERGWETMSVSGWRFPPRYDSSSNLLEWAILAKMDTSGQEVVNYNTRILGRKGVMELVLVANPAILDGAVNELKGTLSSFDFSSGERYADYREGDMVAEFGLAALIVGGAAAVASKKGVWAALAGIIAAAWKFIVVAVLGFFSWLFSRVLSIFKRNS